MNEKLSPPMAVCTVCGAYSRSPNINERCGRQFNAKRCTGVMRSAISNNDWKECTNCNASGKEAQGKCSMCEGIGWFYCR